jgi:transcriptional regulator with XRE-family HTH domain
MARMVTGDPVSGRPDQDEQAYLAAGVGAALRSLRRAQGLSLRDLERRSGVNRSTISRLEHGLRRPRPSTLGWLAWAAAGPDKADAVKQALCSAAGDSLVLESRWSERAHARRAWRRLVAGGMEIPAWMIAPYVVQVLGGVMPDRLPELRAAQERARAGDDLMPEHMRANLEALFLGDELDRATPHQLRSIGRAMAAEDNAAKKRAARKRRRELRARLGLAGADIRRPVRVPREEREMYAQLMAFDRAAYAAARLR